MLIHVIISILFVSAYKISILDNGFMQLYFDTGLMSKLKEEQFIRLISTWFYHTYLGTRFAFAINSIWISRINFPSYVISPFVDSCCCTSFALNKYIVTGILKQYLLELLLQ